jgi:hypothetical protein
MAVSNQLLARVRANAASLQNGHKNDPDKMCATIADMALVIADIHDKQASIIANGCGRKCGGVNWPMAASLIGGLVTVAGTVLASLALFR